MNLEALRVDTLTRFENVQAEMGKLAGTGGFGGPPGLGYGGVSMSLINPKDMRLPPFPEKPESVEMFQRWFSKLGQHCARTQKFACADLVFKKVKGRDRPLSSFEERWQLLYPAQHDADAPMGTDVANWN